MKAIILAAGRGTRLGALTDGNPKCLSKVAGKSLLDWEILALRQAGVHEIGIVTGYMAEKLPRDSLTFFCNERWSETNMLMSLISAEAWLESYECIVSYSDILYSSLWIRRLILADFPISISYDKDWLSLWRERFDDPLSDAETFKFDKRGQLTEIGTRAERIEEIQGQYMGLLKFKPEGWKEVQKCLGDMDQEEKDKMHMTAMLNMLLQRGIKIGTIPVEGKWCEVDNPSDIALYEGKIAEQGWHHDWRE